MTTERTSVLEPTPAHYHTLDSECLEPLVDGVQWGAPMRLIRQPGWYHCNLRDRPHGFVHFHDGKPWQHEPSDPTCPVPVSPS